VIGPLIALLSMGILAFALEPQVDWSNPKERQAGIFVGCVVLAGLVLGGIAGRFSFRTKMRRWESFSIEVTPDDLVRQMDGEETRIHRSNLRSIREYPRRGFVIIDTLGWQIFVPKIIANYQEFRAQILAWGNKTT
jgi:hypothetical protein